MLTFLIGLFNFLATILGVIMVQNYGRRTLMLIGNSAMAVFQFLVGATLLTGLGVPMIISVICFIIFYEISSGPISWMYMGEILEDKAMSSA